MSEAYSNIVGGGLKLKGISKKKKKKVSEEAEQAVEAVAAAAAVAASTAAAASSSGESNSKFGVGHTAAEMRRLETMAKREVEALKKGEKKSHREKVQDFNKYLGNLTEHYDLPKVSKGN